MNERGGFPETLQEVAVKVIDRERCRKYSGYEHITSSMICAGYEAGRKDACAGDSGGPLWSWTSKGQPIQVGIVSRGTVDFSCNTSTF